MVLYIYIYIWLSLFGTCNKSNRGRSFPRGGEYIGLFTRGYGEGKSKNILCKYILGNLSGAHAFSLYTEPLSNQDAVLFEQERRLLGSAPAKLLN